MIYRAAVYSSPWRIPPDQESEGSQIQMDDGSIMLRVRDVTEEEVRCKVVVGGSILSHKGVNLPGAWLSMEPVSQREAHLIDLQLRHGIRVFGVSFVELVQDIPEGEAFAKVRDPRYIPWPRSSGQGRSRPDRPDTPGDRRGHGGQGGPGQEMPIEDIPVVQKKLIRKVNALCKPVVTATQMLLSTHLNTRPTRAQLTDVANAILDGTDAVMLST